jgi:hypothetical protein
MNMTDSIEVRAYLATVAVMVEEIANTTLATEGACCAGWEEGEVESLGNEAVYLILKLRDLL